MKGEIVLRLTRSVTIHSLKEASIHDVFLFLKEALGNHFSTNNETKMFFGEEDTVLTLIEESTTLYTIKIDSNSFEIVNGMVGYLEEVTEETSLDFTLTFPH